MAWGSRYDADSDSAGQEQQRFCISNKLPSDAAAAGLWTTLLGTRLRGWKLHVVVRVLPGRFRYVPEQGSRGTLDWVTSLTLLSPPHPPPR